jgi:hypothetical protein
MFPAKTTLQNKAYFYHSDQCKKLKSGKDQVNGILLNFEKKNVRQSRIPTPFYISELLLTFILLNR